MAFIFPVSCVRVRVLAVALLGAATVQGAEAVAAKALLTPAQVAALPAPAARPIDFARDIQPILEASCVQCHARGKAKGAFSLETRADFLAGGDQGVPAVAGRSAESRLVAMVSGLEPEIIMPQKGKKLTREQVAMVRAWIDQGMPWPEAITFFRHEPANLRAGRLIDPPERPGIAHPVDRHVDAYFAARGLAWPDGVDDRTYARRVWLDTIGLLPPPAALEAFVADRAPDKRAALVARLLADGQRYAEHWLSFWNDLLRNDYKGPGYTDGGRKPVTAWLYSALVRNLPYDRFVAQLVDPGAAAEGFTSGIIWRGVVNASQVPPMQAAQGIAQVFLGVNLKCASCHDSFINEYTLADAYGLAAVYASGPLEIAECDRPTGQPAKTKFLFSELGGIDGGGLPAVRRRQLAEIIAGRANGRLPRTIVNRLWERFLGRGLVEPVDEMDRPAWSPPLLDWLAEDLVAHGYDLKHTMTRILTSRAYQLPAIGAGETEENYVFRGPAVRRLTAEQFSDALHSLAGLKWGRADAKLNRQAALAPSATLPLAPRWIWGVAGAAERATPATYVFRRKFTLAEAATEANLAICADDNFAIKINGKDAGSSPRRNAVFPVWLDVLPYLRPGENEIAITVANQLPDEGRLASVKTEALPEVDSPAGLLLYARVRSGDGVADFVSDGSWMAQLTAVPTTNDRFVKQERFRPREPEPAVELGGTDLEPWRVGGEFLALAAAPADRQPVERASLVNADPLMTALGRPNREQTITVRQATPTTLQALELTNGATLATLLRRGAEALAAKPPAEIFHHALGRAPAPAEAALLAGFVGELARPDGVEDLLWSLAMHPEFQLIR
jgi:mono/diheme cytochrome c family protein